MKRALLLSVTILLSSVCGAEPNRCRFVVLKLRAAGFPVAGASRDEKTGRMELSFKPGATDDQKAAAQIAAGKLVLDQPTMQAELDKDDAARQKARPVDPTLQAVAAYLAKQQGKTPEQVQAEIQAIKDAPVKP